MRFAFEVIVWKEIASILPRLVVWSWYGNIVLEYGVLFQIRLIRLFNALQGLKFSSF